MKQKKTNSSCPVSIGAQTVPKYSEKELSAMWALWEFMANQDRPIVEKYETEILEIADLLGLSDEFISSETGIDIDINTNGGDFLWCDGEEYGY